MRDVEPNGTSNISLVYMQGEVPPCQYPLTSMLVFLCKKGAGLERSPQKYCLGETM